MMFLFVCFALFSTHNPCLMLMDEEATTDRESTQIAAASTEPSHSEGTSAQGGGVGRGRSGGHRRYAQYGVGDMTSGKR